MRKIFKFIKYLFNYSKKQKVLKAYLGDYTLYTKENYEEVFKRYLFHYYSSEYNIKDSSFIYITVTTKFPLILNSFLKKRLEDMNKYLDEHKTIFVFINIK